MDEAITISPQCFHSCLKARGSPPLSHSILCQILYIVFIPWCIRKLLWCTPSPLSPLLRQPVSLSELTAPCLAVPDVPCSLPGLCCCLSCAGHPQKPTQPFSLISFPGCVTDLTKKDRSQWVLTSVFRSLDGQF